MNLEDYLALPYTIELVSSEEEGYFTRVRELPGCMVYAETPELAMQAIHVALQEWIENALQAGTPIPTPQRIEEFSGKFVVRVPKSLHYQLVIEAERQGVSLNNFINVALGKAVGNSAE